VFLLTGISALIGVLTNRLSRVMDRADHLGAGSQQSDVPEARFRSTADGFDVLRPRSRLLMRAIQ
jgi:hypothetical protein